MSMRIRRFLSLRRSSLKLTGKLLSPRLLGLRLTGRPRMEKTGARRRKVRIGEANVTGRKFRSLTMVGIRRRSRARLRVTDPGKRRERRPDLRRLDLRQLGVHGKRKLQQRAGLGSLGTRKQLLRPDQVSGRQRVRAGAWLIRLQVVVRKSTGERLHQMWLRSGLGRLATVRKRKPE